MALLVVPIEILRDGRLDAQVSKLSGKVRFWLWIQPVDATH